MAPTINARTSASSPSSRAKIAIEELVGIGSAVAACEVYGLLKR